MTKVPSISPSDSPSTSSHDTPSASTSLSPTTSTPSETPTSSPSASPSKSSSSTMTTLLQQVRTSPRAVLFTAHRLLPSEAQPLSARPPSCGIVVLPALTMINRNDAMVHCCADCGIVAGEGVSLKACKSCLLVKYCNVNCQRNHWPKHKKECKQRAAELNDEALFKDPPAKEDCPICFLPMPLLLISCMSLPPATITSVPIYDFAEANEGLASMRTELIIPCCGKSICGGCEYSCRESGNNQKCPFCNTERMDKSDEECSKEIMKRVDANDVGAIHLLGNDFFHGLNGVEQDQTRAIELYARAADLGYSKAHSQLGAYYHAGGDSKKEKFHYEAAAMAGDEAVRNNLGTMEAQSGNMERAVKHWMISASAGHCSAMDNLLIAFNKGLVSRDAIDSSLTAYNNACAEMRSEARDAAIRLHIDRFDES